jgi:GNAT superfamily N-acetyltransferase
MTSLKAAIRAVSEALAAEAGCDPEDFFAPTVHVCERPDESTRRPLVRRYPPHEPAFAAVSLGTGAVVSASRSILPEVEELYRGATRDEVFEPARLASVENLLKGEGTRVYAPIPRLLGGTDTLRDTPYCGDVRIVVESDPSDEQLQPLEPEQWPNAFSPRAHPERPTTALAIATDHDEVIGVGTTSADSEQLWQIGLDVAERFRGRGVGTALTAALARHALEAGSVPFYGLAAPNVPSLRTALAAGLVPAWVETFVTTPR